MKFLFFISYSTPGVTDDILNKTASPTSSTAHLLYPGATTAFGLFVFSKSSNLTLESCYQIAIVVIVYRSFSLSRNKKINRNHPVEKAKKL